MIIDPAREDRGFHGYAPGLRKSLHPAVQFASRGSDLAFQQDMSTRILDAIANRFLVNIQADVIHTLHEEPPWLFSESTFPLSSAFCTPVLLTRLNIQTTPPMAWSGNARKPATSLQFGALNVGVLVSQPNSMHEQSHHHNRDQGNHEIPPGT